MCEKANELNPRALIMFAVTYIAIIVVIESSTT